MPPSLHCEPACRKASIMQTWWHKNTHTNFTVTKIILIYLFISYLRKKVALFTQCLKINISKINPLYLSKSNGKRSLEFILVKFILVKLIVYFEFLFFFFKLEKLHFWHMFQALFPKESKRACLTVMCVASSQSSEQRCGTPVYSAKWGVAMCAVTTAWLQALI